VSVAQAAGSFSLISASSLLSTSLPHLPPSTSLTLLSEAACCRSPPACGRHTANAQLVCVASTELIARLHHHDQYAAYRPWTGSLPPRLHKMPRLPFSSLFHSFPLTHVLFQQPGIMSIACILAQLSQNIQTGTLVLALWQADHVQLPECSSALARIAPRVAYKGIGVQGGRRRGQVMLQKGIQ